MLKIKRDGKELKATVSKVFLRDSLSEVSDSCDIEMLFDDFDVMQTLDAGYQITIEHEGEELGTFEVTNVSINENSVIKMNTDSICATQSMKTPRSETFRNERLSSIIKKIGQRYNLDVFISKELKEVMISYIAQVATSDLNFLSDLAATYGADIKLNANKLLFMSSNFDVLGHAELGEISSYSIKRNLVDCCKTVNAMFLKQLISVGEGSPVYEIPQIYYNEDEARIAAQNLLKTFKRKEFNLDVTTTLNTDIKSGVTVTFKEQEWIVFDAVHTMGSDSFHQTSLSAYLKQ